MFVHHGSEGAVRVGGGEFLTSFQYTLGFLRDVFLPQHSFNVCKDSGLGNGKSYPLIH